MKDTIKFFGFLIILFTIITACSKDPVTDNTDPIVDNNEPIVDNCKAENYTIKSIISHGKTISKFIYNDSSKIIEYQSFYFCNTFTYDDFGRLLKQVIAVDPNIYSSSIQIKTDELMTSQNSTPTANYISGYNSAGKVATQKNYYKKNNQFELTSMISLEYKGDKIIKRNLHDDKNIITQFDTYEYDDKGNVTKEKYYSFLSSVGSEPNLIRETSYKYDDKNNPYKILKCLGQPGTYTNTNNIIEINSVLDEDVPGIDKFTTSKTTYEYNDKGFPTKVNNTMEYIYE